jgi:hypothetical protein
MQKLPDGRDFDWDDLGQLLNRAVVIDRDRITELLPIASGGSDFSRT